MYSELQENSSGSFEKPKSSIKPQEEKTSDNKSNSNGVGLGVKKPIKKSSDLRQSLMDDENGGSGNGCVSPSMKNGKIKGNANVIANGVDDPYYVFKEDLLTKLELVDDDLQRYSRLVKNTVSKMMKCM